MRAFVKRISRRFGVDTYEVKLEDGRCFILHIGSDREVELKGHVVFHAYALYGVELDEDEIEIEQEE